MQQYIYTGDECVQIMCGIWPHSTQASNINPRLVAPASKHDGRADCYNKQNMELRCFLRVDTAGVRMWGRHERVSLLAQDYCAGS